MRAVLDTNIFISAVLGGSLAVIVDEWIAGKFKLVITDAIAREYLEVIHRPKFRMGKLLPYLTIFCGLGNLSHHRKKFM